MRIRIRISEQPLPAQPVSYSSTTTDVCTIVSGKLHVVAPGQCTIDANQAGSGNYNAAPQVEQTFSIAQKTVHVDATPDGKMYGMIDPNVTADYVLRATDFVGSDTAAAVTGVAVCSLASHGADGGTYSGAITCTPGTLSAGNYTFVQGTAADFTISPANQSISFPAPSGVKYGDPDSALGATASSGLPVSYTSKTSSVCTIASGKLHVVTTGQCTIDADQAGNANYNAAPTMEQTFTIGREAQAISFSSTPPSSALFGGTYTPAASGGASGNAVAFTIDPSSAAGACRLLAGQVRFIGPGLCVIDANEPGNADYSAAAQKQQSLTIGFSKTLSGKVGSALTVASGQAVYLSPGTAVSGSVTVQASGALYAEGAAISGQLSSTGAKAIRLCATKISTTTTVMTTAGLIVAGDDDGPVACAANTFSGSVSITGNLGGVEFDGNAVSGSLTITGNTGLLPGPDSGIVDIVKNKVSGTAKTQL